jgi:hypothetical protein
MNKVYSTLIAASLTAIASIGCSDVFVRSNAGENAKSEEAISINQKPEELKVILPDHPWVKFFFSTFQEQIEKVGLKSLRISVLPKDDVELRVWHDAMPYQVDGIVLSKTDNLWSGMHIYKDTKLKEGFLTKTTLPSPKSGWSEAWRKLESAGILILPDASQVNCNHSALDGVSVIVEINSKKTYRAYRYSNPSLANCKEAKQIINISKIIADEFSIKVQ